MLALKYYKCFSTVSYVSQNCVLLYKARNGAKFIGDAGNAAFWRVGNYLQVFLEMDSGEVPTEIKQLIFSTTRH